jgi:hypothetical protein
MTSLNQLSLETTLQQPLKRLIQQTFFVPQDFRAENLYLKSEFRQPRIPCIWIYIGDPIMKGIESHGEEKRESILRIALSKRGGEMKGG